MRNATAPRSGGSTNMRFRFEDVQLRGTLDSQYGPITVEGVTRIVRDEIDADSAFRAAHGA